MSCKLLASNNLGLSHAMTMKAVKCPQKEKNGEKDVSNDHWVNMCCANMQ